jgi:hypothetical protein
VAEVPKSRGTNRKGNLVDIPGERKSSGLELLSCLVLFAINKTSAFFTTSIEKKCGKMGGKYSRK